MAKKKTTKKTTKSSIRRKMVSKSTRNPSLGDLAETVERLLAQYEQFEGDGKVNRGNEEYWKNAHELLVNLKQQLNRPKMFCLQYPMDLPD